MQLKKMREILPKLYASPVNDKSNSLTTSPKKVTEDKTNLPKRNEGQNCYQGTEAEDKLTLQNRSWPFKISFGRGDVEVSTYLQSKLVLTFLQELARLDSCLYELESEWTIRPLLLFQGEDSKQ
ncbi:zinc finger protein 518B [Alligator mississippiensis]|uniref:Zinc finger protein 518B n=1 Tax=Alligator mississippiensis TaxID=8496 RepID=A0A151P9T9_ALLMI|nr:zinc finger protein 518B [Alligator mississippiensis]